MATVNPLVHPTLTALDWAVEPERKLESLLKLWLGHYFSGNAFATRGIAGNEAKVFLPALVRMQENGPLYNPSKPVLEVSFDGAGCEWERRSEFRRGYRDEWIVTVVAKVPSAMTVLSSKTVEPEYLVRRLASQALWLFSSSETEALAEHGVVRMAVEMTPTIHNSGTWLGRIMTVSMETFRQQSV